MVSDLSATVLCLHTGKTGQYQAIRITNILCWFLERLIFPGKMVIFRAF